MPAPVGSAFDTIPGERAYRLLPPNGCGLPVAVTVTPETWTARIGAGGSVTFGFQADGSGVPGCAGCCG